MKGAKTITTAAWDNGCVGGDGGKLTDCSMLKSLIHNHHHPYTE